jgi:hypothetical protein
MFYHTTELKGQRLVNIRWRICKIILNSKLWFTLFKKKNKQQLPRGINGREQYLMQVEEAVYP